MTLLAVAVLVVAGVWLAPGSSADGAAEDGAATSSAQPQPKPLHEDTRVVSDAERLEALSRARVWQAPKVPISRANLGAELNVPKDLSCKFQITDLGGTTPKFDCTLDTGEEIRIKYGKGPEIPAETAATRLLKTLGFAADEVVLVERLRCYGCPEEPFSTMKAVEITRSQTLYKRIVNYEKYDDFTWVARERKFPARPIETKELEGWAFFELDKVDQSRGGGPRAHVDALRLMAILLAHWDNKSENQRLVCLSSNWPENRPCPEPFLLLQDVGATFGPSKVNVKEWEKVSMWRDRPSCAVSMRDLPYNGATFNDSRVTEAGRQFFGKLLSQLSDRQLADLFAGARFDQKRGLFSAADPVSEWVRVFKAKVRAITDGPPCPTT